MLPAANQQSKTSSTRLRWPLPCFDGIVIWSILSQQGSVMPLRPDKVSSSSSDPTHDLNAGSQHTVPSKDARHTSRLSLTHNGIGVPQYRFLETFQSRALEIQLPKRPSPTCCGTQRVSLLFATTWSTMGWTRTNYAGIAR